MDVEESEDFRLRVAEGVEHRARLERGIVRQIHDELHAHRPVASVMVFRQTEKVVQLPADRTDRAIAHHGQRGVNVHARRETAGGRALFAHALIEQADAGHFSVFNERLGDRHAGPDLHGARALHLRADPLHELSHREHHAAALVEEAGCPGQLQRLALEGQRPFARANEFVGEPQHGRTPARPGGIEQVKHLLFAHRRGHGDAGLVNIRNARPQGAGFRDHAGNAKADVVRAFVAKHLERQTGRHGAFHRGRAVGMDELSGQRGKKTRRGRAEADADDVRVHARAVNGRGF